jgi:hypothetical protein
MISGYFCMYSDMNGEFGRVDATGERLRRSFLRHVAALAGMSSIDPDQLVLSLVQSVRFDDSLIADLARLTEQYVAAASTTADRHLAVILRGHLSILEHLVITAGPEYSRQLHEQLDCFRIAIEHAHRTAR